MLNSEKYILTQDLSHPEIISSSWEMLFICHPGLSSVASLDLQLALRSLWQGRILTCGMVGEVGSEQSER